MNHNSTSFAVSLIDLVGCPSAGLVFMFCHIPSLMNQFSSVQLLSRIWLFATPWTTAHQASLSITSFWSLPKLLPLSRWSRPTISSSVVPFSSCPQSFSIRVFSNESVFHIRWPKSWSFSFSISPSNEYSGLISFRMDWLEGITVPKKESLFY